MPVYSVYEPLVKDVDPGRQVDQVKFVKEGFSLFAFILPWLYFIVKRMWIALAAYLLVILALVSLGYGLGLPEWMTQVVSAGVSLLIGLEAQNLYQASLERTGYKLSDVVAGQRLVQCEADYFAKWKPVEGLAPTATDSDSHADISGGGSGRDARLKAQRSDVIGGLES